MHTQPFDSMFHYLIDQASTPAKLVVLILLLFSILSWAIILSKQRSFSRARRESQGFIALFRRCAQWTDAYPHCEQFKQSPLVSLFLAAYEQWVDTMGPDQEGHRLSSRSLVQVERALKQAAIVETERLEKHLSWLASIATSSPFIGLFGTVIGIIIAFEGLSVQTPSSIQAVAPGIAEALVATAAGLFVAVPAYIGYNHFLARVREFTGVFSEFSLELLNAIERSFSHDGILRS